MKEKTINDEIISNTIEDLFKHDNNMQLNVAQHEIRITRYENIFMKF